MGPYIDKIAKRFNLTGCAPEESPMSDGFTILPEDISEEPTSAMESEFRSLIGSLSFAVITVRWDIAYAVSVLSRYLMKPNRKVIIAEGEVSSAGRSKHIDVRFKAVAQSVTDGTVCVRYVPSKWKVADIMTKPLGKIPFNRLRDMVTTTSMETSCTIESPMETEEELVNLIFDC
jgi:hypothetical protein